MSIPFALFFEKIEYRRIDSIRKRIPSPITAFLEKIFMNQGDKMPRIVLYLVATSGDDQSYAQWITEFAKIFKATNGAQYDVEYRLVHKVYKNQLTKL